jgi:hypothetical protein
VERGKRTIYFAPLEFMSLVLSQSLFQGNSGWEGKGALQKDKEISENDRESLFREKRELFSGKKVTIKRRGR